MTVDEELFKRMSTAYEQIVEVLDGQKLNRDEAISLVAQILCQLSNENHEDFMLMMDRFYSLERFLRPQSEEIH